MGEIEGGKGNLGNSEQQEVRLDETRGVEDRNGETGVAQV